MGNVLIYHDDNKNWEVAPQQTNKFHFFFCIYLMAYIRLKFSTIYKQSKSYLCRLTSAFLSSRMEMTNPPHRSSRALVAIEIWTFPAENHIQKPSMLTWLYVLIFLFTVVVNSHVIKRNTFKCHFFWFICSCTLGSSNQRPSTHEV